MYLALLVQTPFSLFPILVGGPPGQALLLQAEGRPPQNVTAGSYIHVEPDTLYTAWLANRPQIKVTVRTPKASLVWEGDGYSG